MEERKNKTLVVGLGNDILTDDAVGPKLCDSLKNQYQGGSIQFVKLNVGGFEVLEFIQGYPKVIFIDAIKTEKGKVGEVYLFTPKSFKETRHLSNLHDINFITALNLGVTLNFQIPGKIYIIAIEIKEDMVFSDCFTQELAGCYETVKDKVLSIINELIPIEIIN